MKIVILVKKKAGMTREAFIEHYETSHAIIGKRLLLEDEEKFQDRLKTRLFIVDEYDNGTLL